jgi:hypothetical protein
MRETAAKEKKKKKQTFIQNIIFSMSERAGSEGAELNSARFEHMNK